MIYKPRPYQQEAIEKGIEFFTSKKYKGNGIEVIGTGLGKSIIVAETAKQLSGKTLCFAPSKELIEQNVEKFTSYGYSCGVYSASVGRKDIDKVTFATIGSVVNKPELFKEFDHIIVDECHHGMNPKEGNYKKFFDAIGSKRILGLSATPYRLSNDGFGGAMLKFITRTRPRIFSHVVYYVNNKPMFDAGYLSPLKYFSVAGFDRSKLQLNTTGTDYTDLSVHSYFKASGFQSKTVKAVKRLLEIGRKNVLVFTRFIDEAEYVAAQIEGAAIVTGQTPKKERERIVNEFRSGKIKVVLNCGVLTTGFDYPELETIVMARPTLSLALWYQIVGRCIRPHPNKEYGMIVDLCGNLELFGKVEDLWLNEDGGKWNISSNGKQLTNVYFQR